MNRWFYSFSPIETFFYLNGRLKDKAAIHKTHNSPFYIKGGQKHGQRPNWVEEALARIKTWICVVSQWLLIILDTPISLNMLMTRKLTWKESPMLLSIRLYELLGCWVTATRNIVDCVCVCFIIMFCKSKFWLSFFFGIVNCYICPCGTVDTPSFSTEICLKF